MKKILITRKLLKSSEEYASKIFNVQLNKDDKLLTKDELISNSSECDGILSSLTEKFDADIISKLSKKVKIISNFAEGFGNIDYKVNLEDVILIYRDCPNSLSHTFKYDIHKDINKYEIKYQFK